MTNPLSDVATRTILALVTVALLAGSGYWFGSSSANRSWQLKWSERDAADLQSQQQFTADQRRIELKRQADLDAIQKKADAEMATAQRNAANARAQSQRLQLGIDNALAQLRAGGADTTSLADRQAKDKTGLLLAELYREIDAAAGDYAAEADDAFIRGKQCEASYDALRSKQAAK